MPSSCYEYSTLFHSDDRMLVALGFIILVGAMHFKPSFFFFFGRLKMLKQSYRAIHWLKLTSQVFLWKL